MTTTTHNETHHKNNSPNVNMWQLLLFTGLVIGGVLFFFISNYTNAQNILALSGSNTIGANLAPELAKAYFKELGATNVSIKKNGTTAQIIGWYDGKRSIISISANGTSTGFGDLADGSADIVMASRIFEEGERVSILNVRKGDISQNDQVYVIGLDGIAIIINQDNPIKTITLKQVADIYAGKITNWSQLGGKNLAIKPLTRDASSGTRALFENKVLVPNFVKMAASVIEQSDYQAMAEEVANDASAIAYIPFAAVGNNKALAIQQPDSLPTFAPSVLNIAIENYPLSRRLYFYTAEHADNQHVDDFIQFCLSDSGQYIVEKSGYIALDIEQHIFTKNKTTPDTLSKIELPLSYQKLIAGAEQLPSIIRFHENTLKIDARGVTDLDRVATFLKKQANEAIIIIGFSDDTNAAFVQEDLSLTRAEEVKKELIRLGIDARVIVTHGLGSTFNVASNKTKEGRAKNRRVELWYK